MFPWGTTNGHLGGVPENCAKSADYDYLVSYGGYDIMVDAFVQQCPNGKCNNSCFIPMISDGC